MSVQRQFLLGDTQIEAFPGASVRENKQRYSEMDAMAVLTLLSR